MTKFFRRFRQKLLSEGKLSKYVFYAVGEIVLVVIGILIAVQINNWNENRKSRVRIDQILKKVKEELKFNIHYSDDVNNFYRYKEKDIGDVLRKKVTLQDYKNSGLVYLIWNNTTVDISDDAAGELDSFTELLSEEQDTLISKINLLYSAYKPTLDVSDDAIEEVVKSFETRIRETTSWYYLSNNREDLPESAYHFFLNDTLYLNDVAYYESTGLNNHFRYNALFNRAAKDLYIELSHYLKSDIDTSLIKPITRFHHYTGTYVSTSEKSKDTLIIRNRKKQLVYEWLDENGRNTFSLYPENENFFLIGTSFAELNRNESKEVIGLKLTLGSRPERTFRKIE
ncbi:DUF6090 family protein [Croceivirga thetidis]|uniref:Uncharacterized protein n=1 Tax=Croceivirga thetidis TaxID=2721623 RepID=A0ABX1GS40_9FLAO|nr:DUF6090 family protein [Croceivirga thetidis]NKI32746.1 hypothetical protein [Croceivirga thetidis]